MLTPDYTLFHTADSQRNYTSSFSASNNETCCRETGCRNKKVKRHFDVQTSGYMLKY